MKESNSETPFGLLPPSSRQLRFFSVGESKKVKKDRRPGGEDLHACAVKGFAGFDRP